MVFGSMADACSHWCLLSFFSQTLPLGDHTAKLFPLLVPTSTTGLGAGLSHVSTLSLHYFSVWVAPMLLGVLTHR